MIVEKIITLSLISSFFIISGIQKDLVSLYDAHRQKVPFFPLKPEWREHVKDLYVKPDMVVMNLRGFRDLTDQTCCKRTEAHIEDIRDIFYSGKKSYRYVYLVAESGSGKSTLCEYLVYLWVKEHSRIKSHAVKPGVESFMEAFALLFYISLREANKMSKWDIEDMIRSQYSYLNVEKEDISKLILDNTCLIILDGLDEYSQKHPNCTEYVSAKIP